MQTITTPELTLEPLLAGHAEAMYELLADKAIYRYLDYDRPPSVEYLRGVYTRLEARQSPDGSEVWLNWVIRPRDLPLVGYLQATIVSNRTAHVAYVLASKYWGNGYAQRALQAMLEHLAAAYDVDRFLATVEVENQRSIRLLESLGFEPAAALDLQRQQLSKTERIYARSLAPNGKH